MGKLQILQNFISLWEFSDLDQTDSLRSKGLVYQSISHQAAWSRHLGTFHHDGDDLWHVSLSLHLHQWPHASFSLSLEHDSFIFNLGIRYLQKIISNLIRKSKFLCHSN